MHGLLQDFRVALRQLRARPWWSLAIVAVLAIGLAGNAAMFSGFDTWVLRPLDFERPAELLQLGERRELEGGNMAGFSAADLDDLRRSQSSFAGLAAFRNTVFNLDDEVEPASKLGARIEHTLFPLLGVRPAKGRLFLPEEDLRGQPGAVVLIGDRLWRERFQAAPDVLGRELRIDGRVHEIVGVMPRGFEFPEWEQLWVPLGLDPSAVPRDARTLAVVGRLAPGRTLEQARAELESSGREIARRHPATHDGWTFDAESLRKRWVPDVIELALAVSLGAAMLVLLVICANVASLFLAAAETRTRELALRSALGGGRLQLARPLLCEGVLLALCGGVLGLGLAVLWQRAMMARIPMDPPYLFAFGLDLRAGLFAFALALVAGVLSTVPPLLRSAGTRPAEELRGGRSAHARRSSLLRGGLVIGELALSTALVAGALLMVKSFLRQQEHEGGYRTDGLHLAELALTVPGLEEAGARADFLDRVEAALAGSAFVESAGAATHAAAASCRSDARFEAEGRPVAPGGDEGVVACPIGVAGEYLGTLDVRVASGRGFTAEELERGAEVAVVSEGLARALWQSSDVVGRRLRVTRGDERPWLRVVGVVGDVLPPRDMVADGAVAEVQVYTPYALRPARAVVLAVRSTASVEQVASTLRAAIRAAGVPVAVAEVLTIHQALERQRWVTRFFSEQLAVYALAALAIAALGVYGLVADAVARRRYEMAVRLALGASRPGVVGLVARWGLYRAAAGVAVGLALSLGITRLAAGMLGEVGAWDPMVYLLVAVVLAAAAGVAALLPASRAARNDPATLLREG